MYAVVLTGGKQHQVSQGDVLSVELLNDAEKGSIVEFDKVLMVADGDQVKIGTPYVEGCKVQAEVVAIKGGEKVTITKFRRRKHFQKVTGHRQWYTQVKVTAINA